MGEVELAVVEMAAGQGYVVSHGQLLELGMSESEIRHRVASGRWLRRQWGVYQIDRRGQTWSDRLWSAVLAAGDGALVSHRAALVIWGLDGISGAPVEITVPYSERAIPRNVIVHRTRRVRDVDEVRGLPVTSVPRTLLDCARFLPPVTLAKAIDSAIRMELITAEELQLFVNWRGGRGVIGTRRFRAVVGEYVKNTSTDSPSESEALFYMRSDGIPDPVLQHEFATRNGRRRPDFFWPNLNKAVEIDGLDAHASADQLDDDLIRQNDLLELGIELRRFSARYVRRNTDEFLSDVRRFLGPPDADGRAPASHGL